MEQHDYITDVPLSYGTSVAYHIIYGHGGQLTDKTINLIKTTKKYFDDMGGNLYTAQQLKDIFDDAFMKEFNSSAKNFSLESDVKAREFLNAANSS